MVYEFALLDHWSEGSARDLRLEGWIWTRTFFFVFLIRFTLDLRRDSLGELKLTMVF